MDFEVTYTEEQQRFRREVRAWLDANVTPGLTRKPISDEDSLRAIRSCARSAASSAPAAGYIRGAPQAYAGGGLDVDPPIILEEEVDRVGLALTAYYDSGGKLGSATILCGVTGAQKQAFLPRSFAARCAPGSSSPSPAPARTWPASHRGHSRRDDTSSTARRSSSAATTAPIASG